MTTSQQRALHQLAKHSSNIGRLRHRLPNDTLLLITTEMPCLHATDQDTPEHIQLHRNNPLDATITGTQYKAYLVANLALKDAPQAAADYYRIPLEIVLSAVAFYNFNEAAIKDMIRQARGMRRRWISASRSSFS